jgi:hypothetical protein
MWIVRKESYFSSPEHVKCTTWDDVVTEVVGAKKDPNIALSEVYSRDGIAEIVIEAAFAKSFRKEYENVKSGEGEQAGS